MNLFKLSIVIFSVLPTRTLVNLFIAIVCVGITGGIESSLIYSTVPSLTNSTGFGLNFLSFINPHTFIIIVFVYALIKFVSSLTLLRLSYIAGSQLCSLVLVGSSSLGLIEKNPTWFLNTLTTFSSVVVCSVLLPLVRILSNLIVLILLIVPLLYIYLDSIYTLLPILFFVLPSTYFILTLVSRITRANSKIIFRSYQSLMYLSESIARSYIENMFLGLPVRLVREHYRRQSDLRLSHYRNELFTTFPRLFFEMSSLVLIVYSLLFGDNFQRAVAITSSILLVRILPILQQIYASLNTMFGTIEESAQVLLSLQQISSHSLSLFYKIINVSQGLVSTPTKDISIINANTPPASLEPYLPKSISVSSDLLDIPHLKLIQPYVHNFSFGLNFITGPSGCGKSSYIQSILRQVSLGSVPGINSSHVAYLSQFPFLAPGLVSNLLLDYSPLSTLQSYQFSDISDLGLTHSLLEQHSSTLSGGQIKRVSVLRFLYSCRPIFILDEPLTGLSDVQASQMISLLRRYSRSSIFIIVTHNINDIKPSDTVVNISNYYSSP